MDTTYKIGLTASLSVLAVAIGITACNLTADSVRSSREASRRQKAFNQVRDLMDMNICAAFTEAEDRRLDEARREGPEAFRYSLAMIHNDRRTTWHVNLNRAETDLAEAQEFMKVEKRKKVEECRNTFDKFTVAYSTLMGLPEGKPVDQKK